MKKKKNIEFEAKIGSKKVVLPDKLLNAVYKEIINQIGDDFDEVELEIKIDVVYEEEKEQLSDFNQKLKKALEFNPKNK